MTIIFFLLLLFLGGFGLSMGTSHQSITSEVEAAIPGWASKQGLRGNAQYLAGARLFAESGCTNCHTYLGTGSSNLGAPDLSAEGAKGHSVSWFVAQLRCPSCVKPNSPMPQFSALGARNLRKVAVFLTLSKRGA